METDSDSADERYEVIQSLTEEQVSTPVLVRNILSEVQAEFTTWNVAHCHQALTSLTAPSTWRSCLHPDFRSPSLASMPPGSSPDVGRVVSEASSSFLSIQVYSPEGAIIETSSVKLEVIHTHSSLEPHPLYESSSPIHRNVFKGDDSDNMDFIPYADDHTFDQTSHTRHYGSFSWKDAYDPDLEVIVLEAVHRLRIQYALTYDEIEDSNILPLSLRSQTGKPGPLSTLGRRDRLHWTGNTIPTSFTFPPSRRPEGSNFCNRLKTLNSLFCPNLSCIEPLCSVHVDPNSWPPRSQPPSSDILGEVTNPCGDQCFVNNKIGEDTPSWDEADLDMFKAISEISPDVTPCVLAELCLKPCNEVFYHSKLLYSSNSNEVRPADIRIQRRMPKFNDNKPSHFTPNNPCHHTGPCNSSSGCPCFRNQSHCQRNCCCSQECNRRWQGCHCSRNRSRGSCATGRCPCVEALRECDPELCINCRCMGKFVRVGFHVMCFLKFLADGTPCRNSQIQRGARKELEVKKSSWGLGAFLAEPAKAGDLITEYIGELIYELTVESRADLATHRNRCYVFDLNNTFSLDSAYVGNISRFIDHSGPEQSGRVNSQAQVRLVNGDHRIGIFAIRDVEAGSQVLMNYGPMFFTE